METFNFYTPKLIRSYPSTKVLFAFMSKRNKRQYNALMGIIKRLSKSYDDAGALLTDDEKYFEYAFMTLDIMRHSLLHDRKLNYSVFCEDLIRGLYVKGLVPMTILRGVLCLPTCQNDYAM